MPQNCHLSPPRTQAECGADLDFKSPFGKTLSSTHGLEAFDKARQAAVWRVAKLWN
jgi:hypothetical protein